MKQKRNSVFIVELFIMFIILLVVIVSIVTVTMKTRSQSEQAEQLTQAVVCAENVAEVTRGSKNAKQAARMIEKMDAAGKAELSGNRIAVSVTMKNSEESAEENEREFEVHVRVDTEKGTGGVFMKEVITVCPKGEADTVYELETGSYVKEDR